MTRTKVRLDPRRARDRRHRGRQGRRGRRRRGPRERGRHHLRRQQGDAGADGVHDPPQQRRDLRADAGRHAGPARDPADDAAQQGQAAHGVHDLGRRPRRRHHRHLAPPTGRTPPGCSPTRPPSRGRSPGPATSSRCATARAACWSAAATPRPPSTSPRWPGSRPAGVLVEVVNDDGTMKRAPELREFADEHGLAMISIEDLVRYRRRHEVLVERVAETRLPTRHGDFTAYGYRITVDDSEHIALVYGDVVGRRAGADPGALRVPDRRRLRQPPLRLRPAARRGARADRRGGPRRRGLPARPRGPRDRAGRQAAGLPAPGRRPRHRRRQPRPRPARRRAPLRHRHPDAARPRHRAASGC